MPSIYKCVAVRQEPIVIKHEIRIAAALKEEKANLPEPESRIDEQALREAIREEVLGQVSQEREALLGGAKAEAEKCLAEAKAQAELIKQQAHEEGKAEGHKEGYESGLIAGKEEVRTEMQREIDRIAASANSIIASADKEAQSMIAAAERQIIDIALAVARKLLAREIEENPAVVLPIVKTALEKVHDQEQIVIKVSVDDYELVTEAKSDLQIMTGCEQSLTVLADPTIPIGSCVIDTAYGSVDARIDMQFEAIQKALQEVMP